MSTANGETIRIEGGCFCGAVRYRLRADPIGSMVCHCHTCRRLFAAPVVGWLTVASAAFEFTNGKPAEFSTSPPVTRWLCTTCGTQVAYVHSAEPDYTEIATCSLDDPSKFPPTHHSWLAHDVSWVKLGDGLPTYRGSRYGS